MTVPRVLTEQGYGRMATRTAGATRPPRHCRQVAAASLLARPTVCHPVRTPSAPRVTFRPQHQPCQELYLRCPGAVSPCCRDSRLGSPTPRPAGGLVPHPHRACCDDPSPAHPARHRRTRVVDGTQREGTGGNGADPVQRLGLAGTGHTRANHTHKHCPLPHHHQHHHRKVAPHRACPSKSSAPGLNNSPPRLP